jgi:hypothetical protein
VWWLVMEVDGGPEARRVESLHTVWVNEHIGFHELNRMASFILFAMFYTFEVAFG